MLEWNDDKNAENLRKHGISFEEASLIFEGTVLSWTDARIDYGETRMISLGCIRALVAVAVVHTDRDGKTRIISACLANRRERSLFAKGDRTVSISDKRLKALAARTDDQIDYGDIPELDDMFWKNARLVEPDRTQSVTLRVKKSVLDAYRAQGKGYQTRMNAVLETTSCYGREGAR